MHLVLAPISEGDRCWSVRFVNDGPAPVGLVEVVAVDYEWGDMGNEEKLDLRCGPIAPGETREIYRETDTEVRTSLSLRIDGKDYYVELGTLYAPKGQAPRTFPLGPR
jgi:hypothetical protein